MYDFSLLSLFILFFLLHLTHPTPGIEPGSRIKVCDYSRISMSVPSRYVGLMNIFVCLLMNQDDKLFETDYVICMRCFVFHICCLKIASVIK